MAWWGKLAGGAFGFMLGGPLGAALGATLGHQFDKGMRSFKGEFLEVGSQERVQTAFFTATFSVMGYLAKVDGRVSAKEIAMAEAIMRQMQLSTQQRKAAIQLFDAGKQADFPVDAAIEQLRQECHHRTTLLQMFLEIQIQAAMADGSIYAAERRALDRISTDLGFPAGFVDQVLRFVSSTTGAGAGRGGAQRRPKPSLDDAYKVLGVARSADNAEIKKAYRRLMNQHHPDKLVAKGLPDEMMKLATEKAQQIQKAYDRITESRKT